MKYLHILFFCLLLLLNPFIFQGCKDESNYGLKTDKEHFKYSYFVGNSTLLIKNYNDFNRAFDSQEYKNFVKSVERIYEEKGQYIQPEPFFLPIVQKILPGNKYVFVFETTVKETDGLLTKRVAFECDNLKEHLKFPTSCQGYYMIDGWEWPPAIFQIIRGEIKIQSKSLITGYISGDLDIIIMDDVFKNKEINIKGKFNVFDRNKHMFLTKPVYQ